MELPDRPGHPLNREVISDLFLIIENQEDAGWVIDGQHRLAGAHKAKSDIEVPVVGFLGLSPEQQIELFVTINREQKGVPSSLYYDLLKHLPRKLSDAEILMDRANDIVSKLRQDEESPFYRRIKVTTSPRAGELSSTNVIRKLTPHIKHDGTLATYNDVERAGILNNLYRALKQVFPKEYGRADSVFFRTLGFGALMNALPIIMSVTFRMAENKIVFRVDSVAKALMLLRDFDFDAWRQMGTGSAAENQAGADLRTRLEDEAKAAAVNGIEL